MGRNSRALPAVARGVERNVLLALSGVAMGIAIGVLWLPLPAPAPRELAFEPVRPVIEFVEPGRRALVMREDGSPAAFVDVFLTELSRQRHHHSIRTNFAGHFRFTVPPGRYRVQAFTGRAEVLDQVIEVPADDHPDLELRMARVALFHWLAGD